MREFASMLLATFLALGSAACWKSDYPVALVGMTEAEVTKSLGEPDLVHMPPFASSGYRENSALVKVYVYKVGSKQTQEVGFDRDGLVITTSIGLAL
jgi:hypothetical protein